LYVVCLLIRGSTDSSSFPYTTLFRSFGKGEGHHGVAQDILTSHRHTPASDDLIGIRAGFNKLAGNGRYDEVSRRGIEPYTHNTSIQALYTRGVGSRRHNEVILKIDTRGI